MSALQWLLAMSAKINRLEALMEAIAENMNIQAVEATKPEDFREEEEESQPQ